MNRPPRSRGAARLDGLVQVGWSFRRFQETVAAQLGEAVRGRRVAVYGSGLSGQLLASTVETLGGRIVAVVDGSAARVGATVSGVTVSEVQALSDPSLQLDVVVIAASLPAATDAMRERVRGLVRDDVRVYALTDLDFVGDGVSIPGEPWPTADPSTYAPQPLPSDRHWLRKVAGAGRLDAHVRVVIGAGSTPARRRTVASLRSQVHARWVAEDEAGATVAVGRRKFTGPTSPLQLCIFCPAGTVLPDWALVEWIVHAHLWPQALPLAVRLPATAAAPSVTVQVTRDVPTSTARRVGATDDAPLAFGRVQAPGQPWPRVARHRALPVIFSRAPLVLVDPAAIRRVLIIKLDHIGDVVLSVPVMAAIRRRFPDADITVVTASWAASLLEEVVLGQGIANRVVAIDVFHEVSGHGRRPPDDALRDVLAQKLGTQPFDLAVDLRRLGDARDVLDAVQARVKLAFGDQDAFTQVGIPGYGMKARSHVPFHIVDQLHLLLHAALDGQPFDVPASLPPPAGPPRAWLPTPVRQRRWVIALAPGSGDQLRMWPAASYAALATRLVTELNAGIALVGSAHESTLIDGIMAAMPATRAVASMAGRLSLTEFRAAVREAHLFIGNTTGPTHIAAASGVPTLNIFSGQVSAPEWAPRGPEAFVLWTRPSCAPCYLPAGACPYSRVCLTSITADHAFEAARRILLTTYGTLVRGPAGR